VPDLVHVVVLAVGRMIAPGNSIADGPSENRANNV